MSVVGSISTTVPSGTAIAFVGIGRIGFIFACSVSTNFRNSSWVNKGAKNVRTRRYASFTDGWPTYTPSELVG